MPRVEVYERSGAYQIDGTVVIRAPARYVRQVLMDFWHIYRLNPSIVESEVLANDDDQSTLVRTRINFCAAWFCEEFEKVEAVYQLPAGDLHVEVIPEESAFVSGYTRWKIKPQGEYCEVTYSSRMVPDFFIPPVVGKFLIKKAIRQELKTSFENLEMISGVIADRDRAADSGNSKGNRTNPQ